MQFVIGALSSSTMIWFRTALLSLILASAVSGATLSSTADVATPYTQQVQEVLKTINRLVHREVSDGSAGRQMNAGTEAEESYFRAVPLGEEGQAMAAEGANEARGARQAGEMIGSLLGSGLDEVLTNIRPLVTGVLGPFMTTIGITLLEWFSYTDHKTKSAKQEVSKTKKQDVVFDAFEVDFPEYGKFLVLGERRNGVDVVRKNQDDEENLVVDDLESLDEEERQELMARNLEQLDSRFHHFRGQDVDSLYSNN